MSLAEGLDVPRAGHGYSFGRRAGQGARHLRRVQEPVSRLCGELDEQVGAFLNRPTEGDWPYLWIDAIYARPARPARPDGSSAWP